MIRTTLKIDENISAYIEELKYASSDLLNQALSKGGAIFNKIARRNLEAQSTSGFSIAPSKLHKTIIRGQGIKKNFGDRLLKSGGQDNPKNMSSMIKNYLDEKNHLVVVMGRHPTFRPINFQEGKRVGFMPGRAIGGTAKGGENNPKDIINIFQKLNDGGTKPLSTKQQWLLSSMIVLEKNAKGELVETRPFLKMYGGKLVPMIRKVTYRRTNFATSAYFTGSSLASAKVKSEYERYFDKVMEHIGIAA